MDILKPGREIVNAPVEKQKTWLIVFFAGVIAFLFIHYEGIITEMRVTEKITGSEHKSELARKDLKFDILNQRHLEYVEEKSRDIKYLIEEVDNLNPKK